MQDYAIRAAKRQTAGERGTTTAQARLARPRVKISPLFYATSPFLLWSILRNLPILAGPARPRLHLHAHDPPPIGRKQHNFTTIGSAGPARGRRRLSGGGSPIHAARSFSPGCICGTIYRSSAAIPL